MPLQVDVVSAERRLFKGEVDELYARSTEGEIGILPGHEPILLALATAPLRLKTADGTVVVAIHRGGFLECREDEVNVLADVAEMVEEIDVQRAERALERARQHLADPTYMGDASAELARAQLRLRLTSDKASAE
jgi:F-type H+-transporting ATPase subunit epsilon